MAKRTTAAGNYAADHFARRAVESLDVAGLERGNAVATAVVQRVHLCFIRCMQLVIAHNLQPEGG